MKLSKDSPSGQSTHSSIPQPDRHSALLLVDPQNDFFPGGALGVFEADSLIPLINTYIKHFSRQGWPILATRDWHPANHCSFIEQGGACPTHCIQGSRGAQFHTELVMPPGMMVISKGTDPQKDAQSGFDATSLADRLEDLEITTLFVLGPALQDSLRPTVLDACKLGFRVIVLVDALQGLHSNSENSALSDEMFSTGALPATVSDLGIDLGHS